MFFSLTKNLPFIVYSEENCRKTRRGDGYQGTHFITNDGNKCLPWSSPSIHYELAGYKTNLNYSLEENYCRSPMLFSRTDAEIFYSDLPWCFAIADRVVGVFSCDDVPYCSKYRYLCIPNQGQIQNFRRKGAPTNIFFSKFPKTAWNFGS